MFSSNIRPPVAGATPEDIELRRRREERARRFATVQPPAKRPSSGNSSDGVPKKIVKLKPSTESDDMAHVQVKCKVPETLTQVAAQATKTIKAKVTTNGNRT